MAKQRLQQRCAGPMGGRPQVAALLDLENLLFGERQVDGPAVRAAFGGIVGRAGGIARSLRAAAHRVVELHDPAVVGASVHVPG